MKPFKLLIILDMFFEMGKRLQHCCFLLVLSYLLSAPLSFARFYDIYRADFTKGAYCTAIGGACASDTDGENSFFENPASLEAGEVGLVYDFDYNASGSLEPGMKGSNDVTEATYMAGFAHEGEGWGMGLALSGRYDTVKSQATLIDDQGVSRTLNVTTKAQTILFQMPIAWRLSNSWSIGTGLLGMYYTESMDIAGNGKISTHPLDKFPQIALGFGALYQPNRSFRFGLWGRTPLTFYVNQSVSITTFSNTVSFNEDVGLTFPWLVSSGFSWMPWQDERTLLFDLTLVGVSPGAFQRTFDTFASVVNDKALIAKGRHLVVEPHIGWHSPFAYQSKFKYLLGSYYVTSRRAGISNRPHFTGGLSYTIFGIEVLAAADIARDNYFSFYLTFR